MVKSKTKAISNRGALSNFYEKKGVVREIEAAGICFVIECGRRKSQQISRVRLRAHRKLVFTV